MVIPRRGVIVLWWIGFTSSHQSTFGFRNLVSCITFILLLSMLCLARSSTLFLLWPCNIGNHLNILLLLIQLDHMISIWLDNYLIFINIIFFFFFFDYLWMLILLLALETLLIRLALCLIYFGMHLGFYPHVSCQIHKANREFGRNLLIYLFLIERFQINLKVPFELIQTILNLFLFLFHNIRVLQIRRSHFGYGTEHFHVLSQL